MTESKEELKNLLMKVKVESEKTGLKFNIKKKLRSWYLVLSLTSWQINGNVKTVSDFIFLGSKINADVDCSHAIKRCLLHGRIAMSNQDSVLKRRDITLPMKVHIVKAMVFPVVMYGCEGWTIEKAEW